MLRRGPDGARDRGARRRRGTPAAGCTSTAAARGGCATACSGSSTGRSQRIHRLAPGGEPEPLTPEPAVARGLRYADGDVSPDGGSILCVREEHHADGSEATNTIVRLAAGRAVGARSRRERGRTSWPTPAGALTAAAFCWLEWDHPDMPWDAVRLVVDEGGARTVVAGGDRRESICQPTWAAGRLAVVLLRPHPGSGASTAGPGTAESRWSSTCSRTSASRSGSSASGASHCSTAAGWPSCASDDGVQELMLRKADGAVVALIGVTAIDWLQPRRVGAGLSGGLGVPRTACGPDHGSWW